MNSKGERVHLLRKELNLSMEKFGEKLGVKKNSISKIENNLNNLTERMAKAICREYHVSYDWLMTGEGDMFISNKELHESLDKILVSDHDIHKAIVKFILNLNEESIQNFENICSFFTNKKD